MERVQASVASTGEHFLLAVREVAMELGKDPDAKKLWRLVYQVENLAGLRHAHHSLAALVWDVLSQRIGPYRNVLEERHEDLSDPLAVPEARVLAERLQSALKARSRVLLQPMAGLEIALRGLLFEGGLRLVRYAEEVDQVEFDDLILGGDAAGPDGLALTMFKALQLVQARDLGGAPERYVTFDLETTDLDPAECDLVDIAAVRVERGRITETFQSLVRPGRPVSSGARRIHGYTDADLADAPHLEEVWPRFRAFVGGDTLVAHNGQKFDVPVLRRLAAPLGGADDLVVFDTLPLAHSLSGDSAKLGDLAARFGVDTGRSHRALDDARTLVGVYEELERRRVVRSRKSLLVNLLSYLGLSLALDGAHRSGGEAGLLFELSRIHALGRYSDCLDFYAAERERRGEPAPSVEELVRRLGGERLRERLREEPDPARRFPNAVARLQSLMDQDDREPLEAALDRFLERVALSTSQGAEVDPERVNLLTLHSTKGLEFSRVYVVGVEDEQLPGFVGRDDDPEEHLRESRRLLYVGMTRARERLLLTRVDRRNDKPSGGSRFLDEMGLALERPGRSPAGDEVPEEPALEESDLPRFEGFG
jgi:DNA polymerase III epsilon subunit family exonuclease